MDRWHTIFQTVLNGLPFLVAHFSVSVIVFILGIWLYITITPFNEFKLIKTGNTAASISLLGACLGIALPLSACLTSSVNSLDIIVWGSIAVIIQLFCFKVVDIIFKDVSKHINNGEVSVALVLFGFKVSIGLLNGAAIYG